MKHILKQKSMKTIINSAKKTLENGNLVIFPTETVYGLGGDATNVGAIKKIYGLKKRPFSNPIICHFKNIEAIEKNDYSFMVGLQWHSELMVDTDEPTLALFETFITACKERKSNGE